jgi:uncharacterized protein YdhG (YjbR/CyaY superfamily)
MTFPGKSIHYYFVDVVHQMMKKAANVDEYIDGAPKEVQEKLRQLRALILQVSPDAVERISYGMPFYEYHGRLIYYGVAKNHIGLYIPPPVIEEHRKEIGRYYATKATLHLPFHEDLPNELIKMLVRAKMKKNEASSR